MSNFSFRPAKREAVGLLIGVCGGTGSGKTFSALRLATGIAGGKPFALIDTEAGRAKHYAGQFRFDHGDLRPPFSPGAYVEAIQAADKAGYSVVVVDSMSHEHAGEGGLLEMHDAELDRMAKDDWKKREQCKMAAWIKPKTEHKAMVQKLLQVRAHLILCFRAEEKIEMTKGDDGRMKIVQKQGMTGIDGWFPICEKTLPYELTCSFLLLASKPGIPLPIKVQEQHRPMFPAGKPIDEEAGKLIAAWSAGAPGGTGVPMKPDPTPASQPSSSAPAKAPATPGLPRHVFHAVRKELDIDEVLGKKILAEFGLTSSKDIPADKIDAIVHRMQVHAGAAPPPPDVEPETPTTKRGPAPKLLDSIEKLCDAVKIPAATREVVVSRIIARQVRHLSEISPEEAGQVWHVLAKAAKGDDAALAQIAEAISEEVKF